MLSQDPPQDLTEPLRATIDQIWQSNASMFAENQLLHVTSYALSNTGKLLRGRMLLEACRTVTGDAGKVLLAAAAIEYLHLGTLIHDDMIDRDELRRGKPAVWRKHSADMALLSGDLLYFAAYQILARNLDLIGSTQSTRIIDIFSRACMNLCLGQALEEKLVGNCAASYTDYLEIVRLKTASLFRASLEIGAILGGGSDEQVQTLGLYAENLGIAFQIVDDFLPFVSNMQAIGKPVTSDIKNHRLTAPILYALAVADESDRQILHAIFEEGSFDSQLEQAYGALQAILYRTGAHEKAEREVCSHYQRATQLLQTLPPGAGREHLMLIADQMVQRKK